jgi:hypothetical protein
MFLSPTSKNMNTQEKPQLFKVVKIMRVSSRRQILEKNLTEAEAQRVVARYPNSSRSMVVYFKQ